MKAVLVGLALATLVATPAEAGMAYLDKAPVIAVAKHRILTERLQARRERIIRERRQERRAAEQAAAQRADQVVTVVPSGGWADELRAVGFPEWAIPQMLIYIDRESGGDPLVVNGGGPAVVGGSACGLTQLFPCPGPQALDAITNLRYAYAKFQASGFAPWGG